MTRPAGLASRLVAEFVGTAFLLAGVVGSGIMAENLTDDAGLQLLQNAFATGAILVALILALGPASGAHFNPVVTLADRVFGGIGTRDAVAYVVVQFAGAAIGVMVADVMFDLPAVDWSTKQRTGFDLWTAEAVATLGLLLVIFGVVRSGRAGLAAFSVGAYIAAAYYFTSSTSFANPAVTAARTLSDTFAGIAPEDVPAFIAAQLVGTAVALVVIRVIYPDIATVADQVVVPHDHTPTPGADNSSAGPATVGPSTAEGGLIDAAAAKRSAPRARRVRSAGVPLADGSAP